MLQCPYCTSYGIYPIKRRWWQRLLRLERRYRCQDCGLDYRLEQLTRVPPSEVYESEAPDDLVEPR